MYLLYCIGRQEQNLIAIHFQAVKVVKYAGAEVPC
jgi:hypothetical protein